MNMSELKPINEMTVEELEHLASVKDELVYLCNQRRKLSPNSTSEFDDELKQIEEQHQLVLTRLNELKGHQEANV